VIPLGFIQVEKYIVSVDFIGYYGEYKPTKKVVAFSCDNESPKCALRLKDGEIVTTVLSVDEISKLIKDAKGE
jgi:hypothetical protein